MNSGEAIKHAISRYVSSTQFMNIVPYVVDLCQSWDYNVEFGSHAMEILGVEVHINSYGKGVQIQEWVLDRCGAHSLDDSEDEDMLPVRHHLKNIYLSGCLLNVTMWRAMLLFDVEFKGL